MTLTRATVLVLLLSLIHATTSAGEYERGDQAVTAVHNALTHVFKLDEWSSHFDSVQPLIDRAKTEMKQLIGKYSIACSNITDNIKQTIEIIVDIRSQLFNYRAVFSRGLYRQMVMERLTLLIYIYQCLMNSTIKLNDDWHIKHNFSITFPIIVKDAEKTDFLTNILINLMQTIGTEPLLTAIGYCQPTMIIDIQDLNFRNQKNCDSQYDRLLAQLTKQHKFWCNRVAAYQTIHYDTRAKHFRQSVERAVIEVGDYSNMLLIVNRSFLSTKNLDNDPADSPIRDRFESICKMSHIRVSVIYITNETNYRNASNYQLFQRIANESGGAFLIFSTDQCHDFDANSVIDFFTKLGSNRNKELTVSLSDSKPYDPWTLSSDLLTFEYNNNAVSGFYMPSTNSSEDLFVEWNKNDYRPASQSDEINTYCFVDNNTYIQCRSIIERSQPLIVYNFSQIFINLHHTSEPMAKHQSHEGKNCNELRWLKHFELAFANLTYHYEPTNQSIKSISSNHLLIEGDCCLASLNITVIDPNGMPWTIHLTECEYICNYDETTRWSIWWWMVVVLLWIILIILIALIVVCVIIRCCRYLKQRRNVLTHSIVNEPKPRHQLKRPADIFAIDQPIINEAFPTVGHIRRKSREATGFSTIPMTLTDAMPDDRRKGVLRKELKV